MTNPEPLDIPALLAGAEDVLALAEKATPGPWDATRKEFLYDDGTLTEGELALCVGEAWNDFQVLMALRGAYGKPPRQQDLEFIAAARTLLPQYVRALQQAVRERDALVRSSNPMLSISVYKCPACSGTGMESWFVSSTGPLPCHSCQGRGVLWEVRHGHA